MMKYDAFPPEDGEEENSEEEQHICCCRPDLSHNETMKLQLLFKDDKRTDLAVFDHLEAGKVVQMRKIYFGETKFQDCVTVGKNRIIYQIFNAFSYENIRIIFMVGESGSGKSMLSKHIANYMIERHKIVNATYLNMDKVSNVSVILARIPEYRLMTSYDNYKGKSSGQEQLIILDNMDSILSNHFQAFRQSIQELLEQTKLRFLVITCKSNWEDYSGKQWQDKIILLPALNTQSAAKLLKMMANDYLPQNLRNIVNLQSHPIFKASEGFAMHATPKVISDIAFLLKKGGVHVTLDSIYNDYCLKESQKGNINFIENQTMMERKEYIEYRRLTVGTSRKTSLSFIRFCCLSITLATVY